MSVTTAILCLPWTRPKPAWALELEELSLALSAHSFTAWSLSLLIYKLGIAKKSHPCHSIVKRERMTGRLFAYCKVGSR